jgi:hypothetical protein
MRVEDLSSYTHDPEAFGPSDLFLVIKSQDQPERRRRLIESLKGGRIGRFEERPISEGLVVATTLLPGRRVTRENCSFVKTFREPRGLVLLDDDTMLVSEIDRVIHIDSEGRELRDYRHPLFAFIHSIDLSPDGRRLLVDSPGYDTLIEIDLASGAAVWEWLAWEHGFNPGYDGVYLARRPDLYREYVVKGLRARLVEFERLGAHGLMTSARTDHPSSACYRPDDPTKFLVTLGHSGDVVEIDRGSGDWRHVVRGLAMMPHGILPHGQGWMVTNTMRGECWLLSTLFELECKIVFAHLGGKPTELAENEWLQTVRALADDAFIGLDANRGLILVNPATRRYAVVPIDENWCVHWCVPTVSSEKRHAVFTS